MLLGWRCWLLLYFGTGIMSEVVAYTWLRQGFAGNSIANVDAVAGLVALALRTKQAPCIAPAVVALAAGLLLLSIGNLHGAAFVIGLAIAFPLIARKRCNPGSARSIVT